MNRPVRFELQLSSRESSALAGFAIGYGIDAADIIRLLLRQLIESNGAVLVGQGASKKATARPRAPRKSK